VKPSPAVAAFPTLRLLAAIAATTVVLMLLWTLARIGGSVDPEVYNGGVLGLLSASVAHVLGTLAGALLASGPASASKPGRSAMSAYLASTVVRFMATPTVAVSLYFLLPVKPQPLLIAAGVGYLLILVVDIATMMRAMQGSAGSSAPTA
jgi:hypothetical protein